MPTLFKFSGLRVFIPTTDHDPPHVHVKGNGGELKFLLHCPAGPVELWENKGFKIGELNDIERELNRKLSLGCTQWRKIHGHRG